MNKVLLTKEQAEALESALEINGGDRAGVSQWHAQNIWTGKQEPLGDLDLETVNVALYVGYEIEKGPAEKVYDYYLNNIERGPVIENVLNLLNIKIKGINC
jgi:hypothetical protein